MKYVQEVHLEETESEEVENESTPYFETWKQLPLSPFPYSTYHRRPPLSISMQPLLGLAGTSNRNYTNYYYR